jgi:hypothetical protein
MEVNTISNEVEEKDFTTCPNVEMMKSDDKEKNTVLETPCPKNTMANEEKESTKLVTPWTKIGFNDVSNTL